MLDWVSQPRFLPELLALAQPAECCVTASSIWKPLGYAESAEARLDRFGPEAYPDHPAWSKIPSWWLRHAAGANTPNWDLALSALIEGEPGLILVEAKANVPELSKGGKAEPLRSAEGKPDSHSTENHRQIAQAIVEARQALEPILPGISIAVDRHYQLSNRLAFAWRLASLGIPTVLLYLGFTGDDGIADVGDPFRDDAHWQSTFRGHLAQICPEGVLNRPVPCGMSKFWLLSRSRPVVQRSNARVARPSADTATS